MSRYAIRMLLITAGLIVGLVLTTPLICVVGIAQDGQTYSRRCASVVGLPAKVGLPLVVLILITGLGTMFYVDRRE